MGTAGVLMSGSGSCLFALCRSAEEARQVHDGLSSGLASEAVSGTRIILARSRP
jgi:4-diphosphocytidyl-2C-methyl-D-erythritol kinase